METEETTNPIKKIIGFVKQNALGITTGVGLVVLAAKVNSLKKDHEDTSNCQDGMFQREIARAYKEADVPYEWNDRGYAVPKEKNSDTAKKAVVDYLF